VWSINKLEHIQHIIDTYFFRILGRIPHISDKNENLPKEQRFTQVFYKCYSRYYHSHEPYGQYHYVDLTLEDAIKDIDENNLAILIPSTNDILEKFITIL
jgi:hypothetical protein